LHAPPVTLRRGPFRQTSPRGSTSSCGVARCLWRTGRALRGKISTASRGSSNGDNSEEVGGWREGRDGSPSRQGSSVSRQEGRPGPRGQRQAATEILEAVRRG
jgi:hypothetical protein